MKKILFLFLFFSIYACSSSHSSSSIYESSFKDDSSQTTLDSAESSFIDSSKEEITVLEVKDDYALINVNGNHIKYYADYIIDGEVIKTDKILYVNETPLASNFLIINGGKLIVNETTIVKKGESKGNEELLKHGVNSSIVVIGENSQVEINQSVINVFSSYASGVSCIGGGSALINNLDILVISDFSHAFSTFSNGIIISNYVLVLLDGDKSSAFCLYEKNGLIQLTGSNNYIEVHGNDVLVGKVISGVLVKQRKYIA